MLSRAGSWSPLISLVPPESRLQRERRCLGLPGRHGNRHFDLFGRYAWTRTRTAPTLVERTSARSKGPERA
jgi:hypothetical protein